MDDLKDSGLGTVIFDAAAVSILENVFNYPGEATAKTASIKFMITRQDENALCSLGYSQVAVEKMTPQEAAAIIQAGIRAEA
jgi:hypothetical protein